MSIADRLAALQQELAEFDQPAPRTTFTPTRSTRRLTDSVLLPEHRINGLDQEADYLAEADADTPSSPADYWHPDNQEQK